jgi:hypothetical protein
MINPRTCLYKYHLAQKYIQSTLTRLVLNISQIFHKGKLKFLESTRNNKFSSTVSNMTYLKNFFHIYFNIFSLSDRDDRACNR